MMNTIDSQPEAFLSRMSSLADATRLRLLHLLGRQELGVIDLCDILQMPQSTISRHLKILSDQGWVRSNNKGTTHLYRMPMDQLKAPARRLWLLAHDQIANWATIQQDDLRLARRLRRRQDRAQAFFAGAAGEWEKLRNELYGEDFARAATLALLPRQYVVADLGCGTGQVAAGLAAVVRLVIAVDNSPAMLRAARKRISGLVNVDLRRGDLEALPIEDRSCDAAMLLLALTYAADPMAVVKEARRIFRPGGKLVVVDLLPHDREDFQRRMGQQCRGFSLDRIKEILNVSGFEVTSATPLPPAHLVKGPALFLATGHRNRSQIRVKP
jgi:ArsR family transcriptional regulator